MVLSMFNQLLFEFRCKCGHVEKIMLSRLDNVASWTCESCGAGADLRTEPYATALSEQRHIASEIDKQARQSGQKIERLD